MNATQLKYIISQCRFFIGARTHATIAAMSTGVPCTSIAYSVKARGINRDLFGSEDMVLQTPDVSAISLRKSMDWLMQQEHQLRDTLGRRMDELRAMARAAAASISGQLVH
jgi:colanic acid/amylovoran biosynthesis protein